MDTIGSTLLNETEGDGAVRLMASYRHGRTKKEVADELGVHPSLITMIEKGHRNISRKLLRKMIAQNPELFGAN